eukprot:TRINITY_DN4877_c0_g2_i2.p1 TRINITY_DN4877_c0_g2~~TRINITY_DN4877_c0_g2_i2.p1  ORF type:complete len:1297 (+),score=272.36 TRINITY_DN4877_c0_g2_i2:69-3959(+)
MMVPAPAVVLGAVLWLAGAAAAGRVSSNQTQVFGDGWSAGNSRVPPWYFVVMILGSIAVVAVPLMAYTRMSQWRLYVVVFLVVLLALLVVGEITWYLSYVSARASIIHKAEVIIGITASRIRAAFMNELETGAQIIELVQAGVRSGTAMVGKGWPADHTALAALMASLGTDAFTLTSVYYGLPGHSDAKADGGPTLAGISKHAGGAANVWEVMLQSDYDAAAVPEFVACPARDRAGDASPVVRCPAGDDIARRCGRDAELDFLCQATCAGSLCRTDGACGVFGVQANAAVPLPARHPRFCRDAAANKNRRLNVFTARYDVQRDAAFSPDVNRSAPYAPLRSLPYDALSRPWWREAAMPAWTLPYKFPSAEVQVGLTISGGLHSTAGFEGVAAVDFTSKSFGQFIAESTPTSGSKLYMRGARGAMFTSSVPPAALSGDSAESELAEKVYQAALGEVGGDLTKLFEAKVRTHHEDDAIVSVPVRATYSDHEQRGCFFLLIYVPYSDTMQKADHDALLSLASVIGMSVVGSGVFVWFLRRTVNEMINEAIALDLDAIVDNARADNAANKEGSAVETLSRCREVRDLQASLQRVKEQIRTQEHSAAPSRRHAALETAALRLSSQAARRGSDIVRQRLDPDGSALQADDIANVSTAMGRIGRRASAGGSSESFGDLVGDLTPAEVSSLQRVCGAAAATADTAAAEHLTEEERQTLQLAAAAVAAASAQAGDAGDASGEQLQLQLLLQTLATRASGRALGPQEAAPAQGVIQQVDAVQNDAAQPHHTSASRLTHEDQETLRGVAALALTHAVASPGPMTDADRQVLVGAGGLAMRWLRDAVAPLRAPRPPPPSTRPSFLRRRHIAGRTVFVPPSSADLPAAEAVAAAVSAVVDAACDTGGCVWGVQGWAVAATWQAPSKLRAVKNALRYVGALSRAASGGRLRTGLAAGVLLSGPVAAVGTRRVVAAFGPAAVLAEALAGSCGAVHAACLYAAVDGSRWDPAVAVPDVRRCLRPVDLWEGARGPSPAGPCRTVYEVHPDGLPAAPAPLPNPLTAADPTASASPGAWGWSPEYWAAWRAVDGAALARAAAAAPDDHVLKHVAERMASHGRLPELPGAQGCAALGCTPQRFLGAPTHSNPDPPTVPSSPVALSEGAAVRPEESSEAPAPETPAEGGGGEVPADEPPADALVSPVLQGGRFSPTTMHDVNGGQAPRSEAPPPPVTAAGGGLEEPRAAQLGAAPSLPPPFVPPAAVVESYVRRCSSATPPREAGGVPVHVDANDMALGHGDTPPESPAQGDEMKIF